MANYIEENYDNSKMINPSDYMFSNRIIRIDKDITNDLVREITEQVNLLVNKYPDTPIKVLISSFGGSVDAGFAIIDVLNATAKKTKVEVYGLGLNASMAAVIFICTGSEGSRYLFPHSSLMLHQVIAGMQGQLSDIEIQATRAKLISESIYKEINKRTGIAVTKLKDICDRDSYFTASEAVKNKMADAIIDEWL